MKSNDRIILNTIVLYTRLAISLVISLFTSRWVLLALGEEDFGIYNLVAGIMSLLMFLNMSMAHSTQRFLSSALGKNQDTEIKDTIYYSYLLHFIIGFGVVVLIETIGLYFLENILNVASNKINDAVFCLHCLSIGTFVTIITVPYSALLIAHENIVLVAITNLLTSFLRFFCALWLLYYCGNRLRLYVVITVILNIVIFVIYRIYCKRKYVETRVRIHRIEDKPLMKRYILFTWWNIIGSFSSLMKTQGIAMLLNTFHGVLINDSYGIATQVKGQLSNFSSSIVTATRPQIIKNEHIGNRNKSLALSATTSKVTFLLLSIISIPLFFEMPYVLKLWLKEVPIYAVDFTRITLIISLIFQFTLGISIPIDAVGKVKGVQLTTSAMHCLTIPIGYIMTIAGYSPTAVMIMVAIEELLSLLIWLIFSHRITGLSIYAYCKNTLFPSIGLVLFVSSIAYIYTNVLADGIGRLSLSFLTSLFLICLLGYYLVLTKIERNTLTHFVQKFINKFKKDI